MKKLQYNDFRDNDAWLILRLDAQVKNASVDIYIFMDLPSGQLMAFQTIETVFLEEHHAKALLRESYSRKQKWPKRIILAKGDPAENIFNNTATQHGIRLEFIPKPQLEDLEGPVKASYGQHVFSPSSLAYSSLDDDTGEMDFETAKQMIPDSYDLCWCASGKKFKFCCKPIFKQILSAMACAEEGRKDEALKHIAEAKRMVGNTAEVLCREAIVWAIFDREKSLEILKQALAANPNHPRANYVRGIDCKKRGDYSGAIVVYKHAIDHYPKTDRFHLNEVYNNLGTAFFESGAFMKAKAAWEQALILMPSDKVVRRNLNELIYDNLKLSADERTVSSFVAKFFDKIR